MSLPNIFLWYDASRNNTVNNSKQLGNQLAAFLIDWLAYYSSMANFLKDFVFLMD